MPLEEMTAQRDALLAARFHGVRTVEIDGRRVTYPPDGFAAEGGRRPILTSASKGL